MKKLDDIPKKQIFDVPDGYFDKLPAIIQSRVAKPEIEPSFFYTYRYSLRFVLPVILLFAAGIFWFTQPDTEANAESLLATVQTEDLVEYLSEVDLSTDDLLDHAALDAEDVIAIEENVYEFQLTDSDFEEILNEIEP